MPDGDVPNAAELRDKFSSIPMSVYSLFEVMTLEGMTEVTRPLLEHRPWMIVFFLLFIVVSAFFLMNLITAVIVDKTVEAQEADKDARDAMAEDTQTAIIQVVISDFL